MAEWLTQGVRWRSASFELVRLEEISRTATALHAAQMAAPVWRAEFATPEMYRADARALHARLNALGGAVSTLLVHTAENRRPAAIPSGGLGGVTVRSIGGTNDYLGLSGLPAGSRISTGDFLAILTQSGHRELLEVVGTGSANADGDTPLLQVSTHIRPSAAVSDPVQLVDPRMEARIVPGSLSINTIDTLFRTITFTALQVIR